MTSDGEHTGLSMASSTGKSDGCRKLLAIEYLSRVDALLEDALAIHVYVGGHWWQPWANLRKHRVMRMKLAEARSLGWWVAAMLASGNGKAH